ncbi:MAG: DUF4199 domain-containing protein [Bacteroidota bacterium]
MKNLILRNGLLSAAFLFITSLLLFYLLGGANGSSENYGKGEVVGYLTIILSLGFIFLGIKQYRSAHGDQISFGQALKVGMLITLFPAVAFALYNILYVEVLDPQFFEKYFEYQLEKELAVANPSEHAEIEQRMNEQYASIANVPFQTLLMFVTVAIIGFVVSVISGIILVRKKGSPASTT